jgi:Leucine-rich repeat (LRR) protein
MATFITSKTVGELISISVTTSTGFWKYNHDGSDSSAFANGSQEITITNINGEFTIISCDESGNVSGDITILNLPNNQLTSFDGTGLSSLIELYLPNNQLTSFDGTGLSSLTSLYLNGNQLTSFDGTGLSSLTQLNLENNPLTSFISGDMGQIDFLNLSNLQLTSFDGTGLSSLTGLGLANNQLTSFDGTGLSSLIVLELGNNQLTSFDVTGLSNLNFLQLLYNQFTSFDGTGLTSLIGLNLEGNQLTSFDVTGLSSLTSLTLPNNQLTSSANNQILQQLNQHGLSGGEFISSNGRTSSSNTDYDNLLNNLGWYFEGLDLIAVGNGKLRVKGFRPTQPQPWDGGTIYNIGAIVTHEGQTWNCIQYAPSGYGPFGGYIDVYWTL